MIRLISCADNDAIEAGRLARTMLLTMIPSRPVHSANRIRAGSPTHIAT
jgi:hypothetical protein